MMNKHTAITAFTCRAIILILGIALFLDGLILLLAGKIHIGIIIPLCLGAYFIAYALFFKSFRLQLQQKPILKKLFYTANILLSLWFISFLIFAGILYINIQQQPQAQQIQAIIVLGSGTKEGQPSPTLAKRLDAAANIVTQYPNTPIILSGGVDFGEQDSEAVIMARYLEEQHHISSSRLWLEDRSTSTQLNFRNSKALLAQHGIVLDQPIAAVTSDFHTIRSAAIAKNEGYQQIVMVSAPTPPTTRFNAWLREYFAFMSGWLLNEY